MFSGLTCLVRITHTPPALAHHDVHPNDAHPYGTYPSAPRRLRALDPNRDTTETEIKARLVAEILKIRELKARLDQRAGTFASSR